MRLIESMHYKGSRIRVYLIQPETGRSRPTLGVQIDEQFERADGQEFTPRWKVLPEALQLDEALRWGRRVVDRLSVHWRHQATNPSRFETVTTQ